MAGYAKGIVIAGLVIGVIVFLALFVPYAIGYFNTKATTTTSGTSGDALSQAASPMQVYDEPQPPPKPTYSMQIVPRSTSTHVDYWNDNWHFSQPDSGSLEFYVRKDSGLVVSLANQPGYPTVGYAVTIDKRGGVMTNFNDTVTSATYVARLPAMDSPLNSSSFVRNCELDADASHHFKIAYDHGYIEVFCDGVRVLAASDPMPTPGVQFAFRL